MMNFYIVYADAEPDYIGQDYILGIYRGYEAALAAIEEAPSGLHSYRIEYTEIQNFELD